MSRVYPEKLNGSQPVRKILAVDGTRRLITAFTSTRQLPLSWPRASQSVHSKYHVLKIHSNFILPFMPRSSNWSPSLGFPQQKPEYIASASNMCHMPGHLILFDFCGSISSKIIFGSSKLTQVWLVVPLFAQSKNSSLIPYKLSWLTALQRRCTAPVLSTGS